MRAIALTAVAAMHRSGLVTTQSDTDDPLADVGTTAINDVFGAMMRNLSRSPCGWIIETPSHRRIIQDAVTVFRK